jgi:hypothetical protein
MRLLPALTAQARKARRASKALVVEEQEVERAKDEVRGIYDHAYRGLRAIDELRRPSRSPYAIEEQQDFTLSFGPLLLTARHPRRFAPNVPIEERIGHEDLHYGVGIVLPEALIFDGEALEAGCEIALQLFPGNVYDMELFVCAELADGIGEALADLDLCVEEERRKHDAQDEDASEREMYAQAAERGRTGFLATRLLERPPEP